MEGLDLFPLVCRILFRHLEIGVFLRCIFFPTATRSLDALMLVTREFLSIQREPWLKSGCLETGDRGICNITQHPTSPGRVKSGFGDQGGIGAGEKEIMGFMIFGHELTRMHVD